MTIFVLMQLANGHINEKTSLMRPLCLIVFLFLNWKCAEIAFWMRIHGLNWIRKNETASEPLPADEQTFLFIFRLQIEDLFLGSLTCIPIFIIFFGECNIRCSISEDRYRSVKNGFDDVRVWIETSHESQITMKNFSKELSLVEQDLSRLLNQNVIHFLLFFFFATFNITSGRIKPHFLPNTSDDEKHRWQKVKRKQKKNKSKRQT